MKKKGLLILLKDNYMKGIYCHRNAQPDCFGEKIVRQLCRCFTVKQLSQMYDSLIAVEEEAPMTEEQKLAYQKYIPKPLWTPELTWTQALAYTKNPLKPLIDGFPYYVDYAGFLPSWRNRWRYVIDLDRQLFQVSRGGLELISQETEEFSPTADYTHKIRPVMLASYPLSAIPDDWAQQLHDRWMNLQIVAIPYDELAIRSEQYASDPQGQHDPHGMAFYLGGRE